MPSIIPMSSAGERTVTVNVGPDVFIFRTYFVAGQDDHWMLDIMDAQEKPLITGVNLVPGVDNLLKGMGDLLEGYQLHLLVESGSEKDMDALGNTMSLVWFNPGEDNPAVPSDPMDTIGTEIVPW